MSTKTIVTTYWNPLPAWGKFILIVLVIVALYFALWKPIKRGIDKAKVNKRLKEIGDSIITTTDGATVNLSAVATAIHDAFYNYYGGLYEDEARAITELKRVPQERIQQLAVIYGHLFDENLQQDFIEYVSSSEWDSIKYLFN